MKNKREKKKMFEGGPVILGMAADRAESSDCRLPLSPALDTSHELITSAAISATIEHQCLDVLAEKESTTGNLTVPQRKKSPNDWK
jgi:hypothetical protein